MESQSYFDPNLIASLSGLRLRAARVADGWISGGYASRRYGSSVEFADHKSYSPGDEARHIDWKLHAKTDRYFVRRFEDESNRQFHFLLDCSGSMRFKGANSPWSKWECAATVLVSLAHVCLAAGDAIGWCFYAEKIIQWAQATRTESALAQLVKTLEMQDPVGVANLPDALLDVAERLTRRTCVIVLSDFMDPIAQLDVAFSRLLFAGHQIFAIQVVDNDEIDFPLSQVGRFIDYEDQSVVVADPALIRGQYQMLINQHVEELHRLFQRLNSSRIQCEKCTLNTSESISPRIIELLEKSNP